MHPLTSPFPKNRVRSAHGRGFSLLEVVVVIAIILIIAAISIPRLLSAKMGANEAAAVSALRTLANSEVAYDATYGQGFSASLAVLGPPLPGNPPTPTNAGLVDSVLASGIRNGYSFVYTPIPGAGGRIDRYATNANPVSPGQTGNKYFYVDQTNVIRFKLGGPADANSTPVPQ
jgi:prepilin-type N-terminal cleavage/methylation domain-containing protein